MELIEHLKKIKKNIEEQKEKQQQSKDESTHNVCSWYEVYGNNYKSAGVGFIMPDNYEIYTSLNSYRHDQAAEILFSKYYGKNIHSEAQDKGLQSWTNLLPQYYDAISFLLVSPYNMDIILLFLPEKINEYQKRILYKIDEEIKTYNASSNIKIKFYVGANGYDGREYNDVAEMLDSLYENMVSNFSNRL